MNNDEYREYLKSPEWREIVKKRLQIDNYRCCACGSVGNITNPLECHHLSYKNVGHENPYVDVCILCHCCHGLVTKMMNRIVDSNGSRGWRNKYVPYLNVWTYSGTTIQSRKDGGEL